MTLKNLDKAPFPWFGGKSKAAELVWSLLGDVPHYCEPFFGSGAVLLNRPHPCNRPYFSETVNDLDGFVVNFWRAVTWAPDAVAEAASIGLPVIVSACGGLIDQVVHGETGIIIPQKDEAAMADAMVQLGRDAQLRAWMGDNGRQRMLVHFDTSTQVEKLEQVLLNVIERHARN